MPTLNEVFSSLSAKRRYEVWFVRLGLSDGSGAWWFRYLLTNPGRGGCRGDPRGAPVQVWATWFPSGDKPQTFIQAFDLSDLDLSRRAQTPFHLRAGNNAIEENSCRGSLLSLGHTITWDLSYRSSFRVTLSNKGWIGFSRTPHSDAAFSGQIRLDGKTFAADQLGFGVQGHNCGYRHRNFWMWTHAYFPRTGCPATTLEGLVYEMPFGLVFRKAVLWHEGQPRVFTNLRGTASRETMQWSFRCAAQNGFQLEAKIDGSGPAVHRLPYLKTDCAGTFEVTNNSLSSASILIGHSNGPTERLDTATGAVLELVG